eukprot:7748995-Pyramimonas_sp.AAC.1
MKLAEERGVSIVEVMELMEEGVLADVLKYHVVPGEAVSAADLETRSQLATIQGAKLDVTKDAGVQVTRRSVDKRDRTVWNVTAGELRKG